MLIRIHRLPRLHGCVLLITGLLLRHVAPAQQNVGIGTNTPQKTLDVRGNQRFGGTNSFMDFDSATGKFTWTNARLWVPANQQLIQHSSSAEGLFYNNSQLEYRNQFGNPAFFTNWSNGNGYFARNLGIGTSIPGFPLNFADVTGDKISLYGNSGVHYGFGVQPYLMQIHTDAPAADIAFGSGSSSSFNETMRIKGNGNVGIGNTDPAFKLDIADRMRIRSGGGFSSAGLYLNNNNNTASPAFIGMDDDTHVGFWGSGIGWRFTMNTQTGALKINGSEGQNGQVLASTGGGASNWVNIKPSFYTYKQSDYQLTMTPSGSSPGEPAGWYVIGGLHNQTITLAQASNVIMQVRVPIENSGNTFGGNGISALYLGLYDASNNYLEFDLSYCYVWDGGLAQAIGFNVKSLPAGSYRTHVKVYKYGGDDLNTGWYYTGSDRAMLAVQVIPQ